MFEKADPAFTLFGQKIALSSSSSSTSPSPSPEKKHKELGNNQFTSSEPELLHEPDKDTSKATAETEEKDEAAPVLQAPIELAKSSSMNDNSKTPAVETENTPTSDEKSEEQKNENGNAKEKSPKKPDKILPCPRCNSLDTKFCYYNNYNVNQPRHFCKNCQRYWTAGGTMRNVPVGAGRRKTKNSSSHYRHITVSEVLKTAHTEMPEVLLRNHLKPNGTVLSFGSDTPLCESMASVLNIAEKTTQNCHLNRFQRMEEQTIPASGGGCENGEEHSSGSSVTGSNSTEEGNRTNLQETAIKSTQPCPPQIPYYVGIPWNYPWSSAQWSPPVAPPHPVCASSFPVSFYPAPAFWGCTVPATWNVPWIQPSPSFLNSGNSNSPTLGKHSREGNMLKQSDPQKEATVKQSNSEKSLWVPKTLRIDDPGEAARSSIWATLGIKNDKVEMAKARGLFGDFQSKSNDQNQMVESSPVLHANPAALSRSLTFHENS